MMLVLALGVAGCSQAVPRKLGPVQILLPERLGFAEEVAATAAAPILAEKVPGIPAERALDCLMAQASQGQIEALAQNSALGQPGLNDDIVTDILYKQGTRGCMRGGMIYYWLMH